MGPRRSWLEVITAPSWSPWPCRVRDRAARLQDALHQTRQPMAERLQRKLSQPVPRRVPQPGSLRLGAGGKSARQATSAAAQPRAPALVTGLPDAGGVRTAQPCGCLRYAPAAARLRPPPPTNSPLTHNPKSTQNSHSKSIKNRGQSQRITRLPFAGCFRNHQPLTKHPSFPRVQRTVASQHATPTFRTVNPP